MVKFLEGLKVWLYFRIVAYLVDDRYNLQDFQKKNKWQNKKKKTNKKRDMRNNKKT